MTIIPDKRGEPGADPCAAPGADPGADPGGPLVAVCAGSRCAALWRLRDGGCAADADPMTTAPLRAVRETIAGTRGAVLVRIGCIGACAAAPLVAVAHRPAGGGVTSEATWIAQADAPPRHAGLIEWVEADWDAGVPTAPRSLAGELLRMAPVGGSSRDDE